MSELASFALRLVADFALRLVADLSPKLQEHSREDGFDFFFLSNLIGI